MSHPDASLIKINTGIERVGKQIAITNKLLQAIDPVLIPYRKKDKWGFSFNFAATQLNKKPDK